MDEVADQPGEDAARTPVVRDSAFARFAADKAMFTLIGRDVEVAFMQLGPVYRFQIDEGHFETYESDQVLTEVARMRMGFPELLGFAMNFIRVGIVGGHLKGDMIRSTVDEWLAHAAEGGDQEVDDG